MTRRQIGAPLALVPMLLALNSLACSSGTTGSPCTIDGTYSYATKRTGGTCGALPGDDGNSPSTVSIQTTNGSTELIFGGITGSCPAKVNGCKLDAACTVSASGSTVGTGQLSLTFAGNGITGSESDVFTQQLPGIPGSPCKVDFSVTASRK